MHEAYEVSHLLNVTVQIEAIAAYDGNLLLGTRQGHLLMYSVSTCNGNQKYEIQLLRYHKNFSKKPIQQIEVIPEDSLLLCLTDNLLSTYDLNGVNFPHINTFQQTKGASLFALDIKSTTLMTGGSSSVNRLCVAVKRKLQLYQGKNREFKQHLFDFTIPDVPKVMAWGQEYLCVGFKGEYTLYDLSSGTPKELFPTSSSRSLEPTITKHSESCFVLGRDNTSVLVEEIKDKAKDAKNEAKDKDIEIKNTIKWKEPPIAVVWDEPYMLGLLQDEIVVQTIEPSLFIQTLPELNKARLMYRSRRGLILVASVGQVWCVSAVDVQKQRQQLLKDKQFQIAIHLTNLSDCSEEEKKQKVSSIQRLFAHELFADRDYSNAMNEFTKLNTDPAEVIALFPEIDNRPGSESVKKTGKDLENALNALIQYLVDLRAKICKSSKTDKGSQSNEEGSQRNVAQQLELIDTTLLKCYLQVFGTVELPDKPIMLPPFVEATHCLGYHLTRKGRAVADRVVSVLGYACPDITYSPSLYPITAALLHFMPEEECYHCMASLVASKEKMFITQTKLLSEVTWKTVMQISKKHAKSAAQHLTRLSGAIGPERIYADWQWWILAALPFPHLVRVLDCFFHEGIKVFYRVALAILILFHKHSTNQNSEWYAEATKNGVDHAIDKFCRNMPASPTKLLRTAFSIRALSSQYISRVFIKTEMTLKSKQVITGARLVRSRSSDNLPTSQSQVNIQMMSHTLTIREGAHSPGPRALSMGVYPIQTLKSQILDQGELFTLWSWLPVRITMYQPVLLYTTEEHGCSLTTFYVRVEHHEPTLLMIKTCNNEVFGAYCSTRWFERNQKDERGNRQAYFGTGETFLFSLYPERAKYPWVGCTNAAGDKMEDQRVAHGAELFMAADSKMITIGGGLHPVRAKYPWVGTLEDEKEKQKQKALENAEMMTDEVTEIGGTVEEVVKVQEVNEEERTPHNKSLFMAADSTMVTIGGGDGQAIWMDENIRFGKTDRCATFNNPPLCPSGDFEIRVLEVYGFSGA